MVNPRSVHQETGGHNRALKAQYKYMNQKINKIDNDTAEVITVETITKKETVSLSYLISERDSMVRTKNMEAGIFEARDKMLASKIEELNVQIKNLTSAGLSTEVVSSDIPVEKKEPDVVGKIEVKDKEE